jgi:hypothetical protein
MHAHLGSWATPARNQIASGALAVGAYLQYGHETTLPFRSNVLLIFSLS